VKPVTKIISLWTYLYQDRWANQGKFRPKSHQGRLYHPGGDYLSGKTAIQNAFT
jgi:hypothetical protein